MRLAAGQEDGKKTAFSICDCVDFRVAPAARAANRLLLFPLFAPEAERWALTCVESIICVSVDRPRAGKFTEQPLPHAALRPAHEAIVDRRRRAVFRRAIAPSAAALQHMQDAADHAPIICADDVKNLSQIWAVAPALVKLALRDDRRGQTDKEPPWKRIAKGLG